MFNLFLWEVTDDDAVDETAVAEVNWIDETRPLPESILFMNHFDGSPELFIQDTGNGIRYVRTLRAVSEKLPPVSAETKPQSI